MISTYTDIIFDDEPDDKPRQNISVGETVADRTRKLVYMLRNERDNEKQILALIEEGVQVDYKEDRTCLLFLACQTNNVNIVKALVEKGANINQTVHYDSGLRSGSLRSLGYSDDRSYSIENFISKDTPVYFYIQNKRFPPSRLWVQYGEEAVAEIETIPVHDKKLTHIFNFSSQEKYTIIENISAKTIAMSPVSDFVNVAADRLLQAAAEFKKINPHFDENSVSSPQMRFFKP